MCKDTAPAVLRIFVYQRTGRCAIWSASLRGRIESGTLSRLAWTAEATRRRSWLSLLARKAVVDLLDEGRRSLNVAHPPSGGTIPVNTEFAILEVAAGSPAQPAAPPRERRGR
jgi:hypothetical protein